MSDVAELEKRIASALERISKGLGAMQKPVGQKSAEGGSADGAELGALKETLETERTANAQLEERVLAIKEKQEKLVDNLKADVAHLVEKMAAQDSQIKDMTQVNQKLRKNNRALRDANEKGVGDPALINHGMTAEIDALRASRDSDRAELDAIIGELRPLVQGDASA